MHSFLKMEISANLMRKEDCYLQDDSNLRMVVHQEGLHLALNCQASLIAVKEVLYQQMADQVPSREKG